MRIILSNLLVGGEAPENINDLKLKAAVASGRAGFEFETLIDSMLLTDGEIDSIRPRFYDYQAGTCREALFAKTHEAFRTLADGTPIFGKKSRAALYFVRDPRDVATSLAFHMNVSLDQAVNAMNGDVAILGANHRQIAQTLPNWSQHVHDWLDQKDLPTMVVRYEDLHAHSARTCRQVLKFLGADCEEAALAAAIRNAAFAELQRQELAGGFCERLPHQTSFFRSGRVGDWRHHLNPQQLAAIEETHADTMLRMGYAMGFGD